jgi:hypothetical protein
MKAGNLIVIICFFARSFAHAQGTVNFASVGVGINAPVHLETPGGSLAGAGYMAQLLLDTGGGSFTAVGNPATFIGAAAPGYLNGGVVTVVGVTRSQRVVDPASPLTPVAIRAIFCRVDFRRRLVGWLSWW